MLEDSFSDIVVRTVTCRLYYTTSDSANLMACQVGLKLRLVCFAAQMYVCNFWVANHHVSSRHRGPSLERKLDMITRNIRSDPLRSSDLDHGHQSRSVPH